MALTTLFQTTAAESQSVVDALQQDVLSNQEIKDVLSTKKRREAVEEVSGIPLGTK